MLCFNKRNFGNYQIISRLLKIYFLTDSVLLLCYEAEL